MKSAGAIAVAGVVGISLRGIIGPITAPREKAEKAEVSNATTPTPQFGVGPIGRSIGEPEPFSIFWITDTQFLSETNPQIYQNVTNWIVDNWGRYNGKLVVHTGDLVEHGPVTAEWNNANEAMSTLLQNGIPYTWCAGNHDDYSNGDPTSGWIGNLYSSFDPSMVSGQVNALKYASWAGDYHDGMNTAVSFSAGGLNFLVINIEWNAQPDVLAWVEGLLSNPKYSSAHVIVAPHAYIDAFGSLDDPNWIDQIGTFLGELTPILDNYSSNVFLTLNGHFATDCGYNTPAMINNRNELMFDRQDSTDAPGEETGRGVDDDSSPDSDRVGGATVTILTFSPVANTISVKSYDVFRGAWRTASTEQYTVNMFASPVEQSTIQVRN